MSELEIKNELQEIKKLTVLGAKKVLTMSDVALLTGLSKSHLYKLCCAKKIPHWKSEGGKLTYFDKSEVETWQLQCRVSTMDEINRRATGYITTNKKGGSRL